MQIPLRNACLKFGMLNLFLLIYTFSMVATVTEAKETTGKLSLQQAMQLANSASPELAAAMREQQAVEGVITQAKIRPNPSISTLVQDTSSTARQISLQLSQEFELGNKRDIRTEAAHVFYNKAQLDFDNKRAELHADVIAAFYEVLTFQERLSLAQSSLNIAHMALDTAAKRVLAGKSSPVEETKSKIAESTAKIEVAQTQSQLNASRQKLTALWGNNQPQFESVEGNVTIIPESVEISNLLVKLIDAPIIKMAILEIKLRESIVKVEKSKSVPNITISAGVMNNQEIGGRNQALLGLTIPIPVFNSNQGGIQEAVSRQYKVEDELVAIKSQLSARLVSQYERLNAAKEAVTVLKMEILPNAESAFDAANKGFTAGKFNFLDVLDAQRTLFQAKTQYIQALLNAHQAIAEIERILGDVIPHEVTSDAAEHKNKRGVEREI